jgi:hypothetical protein
LAAPGAVAAEAKALDYGLPNAMVGAGVAQVGGYVYVLGGRLSDGTYSNGIVRYDPTTGANSTVARFPDVTIAPGSSERYAGSVAVHGSKIYYFGGATSVQGTVGDQAARLPKPIPDIVVFDTQTNSVQILSSEVGKTPQNSQIPDNGAWGMGEATIGDTAYLFGGFTLDLSTYTFQRHDWILAFDMSTETIRTLSSTLPYPVQDAGVAYLSSPSPRVYLFGGLGDNNTANLCPGRYNQTTGQTDRPGLCMTDEIVRWDPQLQDGGDVLDVKLPYRVQFPSAGVARSDRGTLAYVLGGLLVDGSASQAILEFNPGSTTPLRTLAPRLDPGLFGSGATGDGNTLTLWGGRLGEANQLTNAIVRFNPSPTAPFPPTSLMATRAAGAIHLEWQPPTYDGDSPVTGYHVYRTGIDGVETALTTTTALSYDDAATKPGANYTYRLTAANTYGESGGARVSTATSTTPPGPVQHFSAYAGNAQVQLSWDAPLENGGADLTGYHVTCSCSASPVSLPASTTSYAWAGLANGASYTFVVRAVNAKGEGTASPTLAASPAPVPDAPANVAAQPAGSDAGSASGVVVSWTSPATSVTNVIVLRGTTPDAVSFPLANLTPDQVTYTDTQVDHGRTYYYALVSLNAAGRSPPSKPVSVSLVDVPAPPTNVQARGLEGLVQVTWQAPNDLGGAQPSAITYAVVRTSPTGSQKIVSPPDLALTAYSDRTATPGVAYTYTVMTQNPRRSAASLPATATALVVSNKPPTAAIAVLPAIATAGDPVTLDASQSVDPDGTLAQYAFDFGDGSDVKLTNQSTVTHAYATNNTYTVKVVVTDDRGNTSAPATARVIIGTLQGGGADDSGGTNVGSRPVTSVGDPQPGAGAGKIPGPEPILVALAALGLALVTRRHLRR